MRLIKLTKLNLDKLSQIIF